MLYARINRATKEVVEFPLSERTLRDRLSTTTLPERITDLSLAGTEYVTVPTKGLSGLRPTATHRVGVVAASYNEETGKYEREFGLIAIPEDKIEERNKRRWTFLKELRRKALANYDRKVMQNLSESRQQMITTNDIKELDAFAQKLRDMTINFGNPYMIDETTFFDL